LTYEQVQSDPNHAIDEMLAWAGETRSTVGVDQQRNLQVQRSTETEEWIKRFTEENPDLVDLRYRVAQVPETPSH
jgi:LPS sulfotransferase NodH